MWKRWIAGGLGLAMLAFLLWPGASRRFDPPQRSGPAGLVKAEAPAVWLMTSQEEEHSYRIGGGRYSTGRWATEYLFHFRIQAHDPLTAQRLWLKELRVVKDDDGGRGAQARILGQDDAVVWTFVHDGPLALSPRDGSVVADRAALEKANPGMGDLMPRELKFYAWWEGLVVTLADGRLVRMRGPGFRAEPFEVPNDDQFRTAGYMTTTWNGSYKTADFGVRHGLFDGRWIGLLSQREAADAIDDGWGDHYHDSMAIDDEGAAARRGFLVASVGRTREFSEGSHPRIMALQALPGTGHYLQGRMLRAPASSMQQAQGTWTRAGNWTPPVVPPMELQSPPGVLVLHRSRMDAQGRLLVTRLDAGFKELWQASLPFEELGNRWALPEAMLLYGGWNAGEPGQSDQREALLALDLASGKWRGWDVQAESELHPPATR